MKTPSIMLILVLLTACQTISSEKHIEQTCQAAGGKLVNAKIGLICAMPASDVGKTCTDSGQCEGLCTSNGQCSAYISNPGCNDILENGKTMTICID